MQKHDYYADPTVFDRLHAQLYIWFLPYSNKLRAYGWSAGFAFLGFSSFLVASGLLAWGLQARWFSDLPVGINDSLVRTVTVLIALFATSQLFKQSIRALPQAYPLPEILRTGRYRIEFVVIGSVSTTAPFTLWAAAFLSKADLLLVLALMILLSLGLVLYRHRSGLLGRVRVSGAIVKSAKSPVSPQTTKAPNNSVPETDQTTVHDFLASVRDAGVNVSIAKALFTAGVRSEKQLHQLDDARLLKIHGVGPATVSKLRAYFKQSQ